MKPARDLRFVDKETKMMHSRSKRGAERIYVRRTDYAPAALRRMARRDEEPCAPTIVGAAATIVALALSACIALSFVSCLIGAL